MGGTPGIAQIIAEELRRARLEVEAIPAKSVDRLDRYDAVIIGAGLYANRWQNDARRFVLRNIPSLRQLPVWFFSSGPLDDSAVRETIPPTQQVATLMERVGARGHMTFGGALSADAKGFPARAMAADHAGDWRNPEHIRAWSRQVAKELPTATPGHPVDHPARSMPRLLAHGVAGWAACAAVFIALLAFASASTALLGHGLTAPIVFILVSRRYFAPPGAREPLQVATVFTTIFAALDLVVLAGGILGSLAMFRSIIGAWLPFALIFCGTYVTGFLMSTLPWPSSEQKA